MSAGAARGLPLLTLLRVLRDLGQPGGDVVLWLEGRPLPPDLRDLAVPGSSISPPEGLERGTLAPKSVLTPIRCTAAALDVLTRALSRHPLPEIADHVHLTDAGGWLLSIFDLSSRHGDVALSPRVPATLRQAFTLRPDVAT